jgi:hypothetical protein
MPPIINLIPEELLRQRQQTQRIFNIVIASPASRCWWAASAS